MTIKGIAAVVGVDGSGKSTLLDRLRSNGYETSTWKGVGRCLGTDGVPDALRSYVDILTQTRLFHDLGPRSRFSLILSLLFAEYEHCVLPAIARRGYVIVESYYLKLVAREIIRGAEWPRQIDLGRFLPPPDLVICLDVAPEVAYARKGGRVSEFEVREERTLEDFVAFQRDVLGEIKNLVGGTPSVTIDGSQEIDEVCRAFCNLLEPPMPR